MINAKDHNIYIHMTICSIMKALLHQFLYNPNVHDCGWITISTHRTPEGAENAKKLHKEEAMKDWMEEYPTEDLRVKHPFGHNEDWRIGLTELSD
jgi:hypothetical protein